jgi:hypothetical protein
MGLVNCYSIHVGIVYEPNDLVAEKLRIVLGIQVRLHRLRTVQLETFTDSFSQHVNSWVCLHYLIHCLLKQLLATIEPVTEPRVQVVSEVNRDDASGW